MERHLRVNLLGPGPLLIKKIIYRAAVLQGLRNTDLLQAAESFLRSQLVLQLVKKFPTFYGTRKFITVLTSARHLSLS